MLVIKDLYARVEGKDILKGINLTVNAGEVHVIMGPNGSGKSTLINALLGHPKCKSIKGKALLSGKDLLKLAPEKRALLGVFASFQHPVEIPGLNFGTFLRTAKNIQNKSKKLPHLDPEKFIKSCEKYLKLLHMSPNFLEREINKGFSGGEKKKAEILQMAVLEPKIALLDEIDSGLDVDALKAVATTIKTIAKKFKIGIVLITHYQRILNYVTPDFVHIIHEGKIVKSGKKDLALKIEKEGYNAYIK